MAQPEQQFTPSDRELAYRRRRKAGAISDVTRAIVYAEHDGICAICRVHCEFRKRDRYGCDATAEIDHIVPLLRGGAADRTNLRLLCRKCNRSKAGGT